MMVREQLSSGPVIFKVGLSRDPRHRFCNREYGYRQEGYQMMMLLACTTPSWAAALERHVIAFSTGLQGHGCRNQAPGGESTPPEAPVFVYVVAVASDEFLRWRLERARQRSSLER